MDPHEILGYAAHGVKWLLVGGGSFIAYAGSLAALQASSSFLSQKIKNQEELDSVVAEESEKLGLKDVKGIFCNDGIAIAEPFKNRIYLGGFEARRCSVRHELYHIFRDCQPLPKNKTLKILDYLFIREPRATAYEIFRIRL